MLLGFVCLFVSFFSKSDKKKVEASQLGSFRFRSQVYGSESELQPPTGKGEERVGETFGLSC